MFDVPKSNNLPPLVPRTAAPVAAPVPVVATMNKETSIIKKEDFILDFGRNFMVLLIGLLVFGIVVLLTVYHIYIMRFDKRIVSLEAEYVAQNRVNEKLANWESTIVALESEKAKFEQMVPEKKDLAQVLVQLESLAKKYNLVFNSIVNTTSNYSVLSETQEFQRQSYEVTMSGGDYFKLKQYLVDIESSLRIVAPKALIYSPDVNMFVLSFDIYHR